MKLLSCPTEVRNAKKHNWGSRNQISPSLLQFPSSTLAGQPLDKCHQLGYCSKHVPVTTWQMQLERRAISLGRGGVPETPVCCFSLIKSGWDRALHSHRGFWGIYDDISFWGKQILVDMIFFFAVGLTRQQGYSVDESLWCFIQWGSVSFWHSDIQSS